MNTDRRFQRFAECALPLATEVAKRALREAGVRPSDVGRIVVVTSTGVSVLAFVFVVILFSILVVGFCLSFFLGVSFVSREADNINRPSDVGRIVVVTSTRVSFFVFVFVCFWIIAGFLFVFIVFLFFFDCVLFFC